MYCKVLWILLLALSVAPCWCQSTVQYQDLEGNTKHRKLRRAAPDQWVAEHLLAHQAKGYITASIDSFWVLGDTAYYDLFYGRLYEGLKVQADSSTQALLLRAGLPPGRWQELDINGKQIAQVMEVAGDYLSTHGYPFYTMQLDNLTWETDSASHTVQPTADLVLQEGIFVTFDSLRIDGDYGIVANSYYQQYLNIRRGDPYNHNLVMGLQRKLDNLPFLQLSRPPEVDFINGIAEVTLPVRRRNASRFDFIVGLVPADQGGGNSSYTITGDFLAEMINKLGYGERLYAQIRRLRPEVQEADIQVDYPYLLGLPLGIDFDFRIFRNSESFIEVSTKAGLQFIISGNDRIGVRLANTTNRILQVDTLALLSTQQLPNQLDVGVTSGGLTLDLQHTDYRINPTRGWQLQSTADLGIRRIIRNNVIESLSTEAVDFNQAYDTLQNASFQADLNIVGAIYLPPNTWSTIKVGLDAAYKYSASPLYDNELYRIGGNRRLRGFEEQSVLTDVYVIPSLEYRLLLDRNSYLSLPIVEAGFFRTGSLSTKTWERSLALGMGLSFSTSAGIFNVSFVAGQRRDIPLNIQTAKIHFGYLSLF